jgi:CRISPR-associated protein Csc3
MAETELAVALCGGIEMHYCQELVDRYLAFYEPQSKKGKGYSSTGCIKPLKVAIEVLMKNTRPSDEELESMIAATLLKLMSQIHNGTAEGRWVLHREEEVKAVQEFARFFIREFWQTGLNRDRARASGNKAALYENTCEFLVRCKKDSDRAASANAVL